MADVASSSRPQRESNLNKIRELTKQVNQAEAFSSEKCKAIEKIVLPVYKKNGGTSIEEYRKAIIQIFSVLSNGETEQQHGK